MTVARQLSRLRCRAASASMAAVLRRRRCTPPTLSTGRAIRALRSTRGSDARVPRRVFAPRARPVGRCAAVVRPHPRPIGAVPTHNVRSTRKPGRRGSGVPLRDACKKQE